MQWFSTILQSMARPLKWWVVVASWEQGVRVRLGKKTTRLDPGVHLRIPFLDRIYVQSTRLRVAHAHGQSISTRKGDIITFGLAIRYQIQDVVTLYQTVAAVEAVLVFDAVSRASHIIATAESDLNPSLLEDEVNSDMPSSEYGLSEVQVSVIGFCQARCYRLISGDGWIPLGKNIDDEENTGEVK